MGEEGLDKKRKGNGGRGAGEEKGSGQTRLEGGHWWEGLDQWVEGHFAGVADDDGNKVVE